jgi:hypothetical protein
LRASTFEEFILPYDALPRGATEGIGSFLPATLQIVVFIEVFSFPIRNITLILKRRAKATCEAIPSARAFPLLVCGELSDCFRVSVSSAVPSVALSASSLMAHTMSDRR